MRLLPSVLLWLIPALSWACSCDVGSLKQQYERAGSVFIAEVDSNFNYKAERSKRGNIVVDHTVLRVFKGTPKERLTTTNSSCEVWFTGGTKYLVFQPPEHAVHMCTGTTTLEEAIKENSIWALERFVSGETTRLVEPWIGKKTMTWHKRRRHFGCSLSVPLPGALPRLQSGELRIWASYDKKTRTYEESGWFLTVPSSYTKLNGQAPSLTVDNKNINLIDSGPSRRLFDSQTYETARSDGLDTVRTRLSSDSKVTAGPFNVNYSIAVTNEIYEALLQLPKQQVVSVPMMNLGSAADDFLSCVAELQEVRDTKF